MLIREVIKARGHPNVRASHPTTLMITKDRELTLRGDCIVAVSAEKGLTELDPRLKEAIRSPNSRVKLTIDVGGAKFEVRGRGDPRLPLRHPSDMVARRSGYIDDRTLMIKSDAAAIDIPRDFVNLLKDDKSTVTLRLTVETMEK